MFQFICLIPLLASKSFLQRANRVMLAVRRHWRALCCSCLPDLPVASYVTIASSLTELYLYRYKIQGGNGVPFLSSREV